MVGLLLTWPLVVPLHAQHGPDGPTQRVQQQKAAYYAQIEYQRCRSDIIELLVKAEPLEQRIKDLEAEVQTLTDALRKQKEGTSAPPTN